MASYPSSVKSFSTKNTGNTVQATHVNDLQDEVTAMQTDLLTAFPGGAAPSGAGGTFDWTPVLTFSTPGNVSVAYTVQVGKGKKVGTEVTLWGHIVTSSFTHTTASGECRITGSPYTSLAVTGYVPRGACSWSGVTKANYTHIQAAMVQSSAIVNFYCSGSGQAIDTLNFGDMPTGGAVQLHFTITFRATT